MKKKQKPTPMTLEKLMELNDYVQKNLVMPRPEVVYISVADLRRAFPSMKRKGKGKVAFRERL